MNNRHNYPNHHTASSSATPWDQLRSLKQFPSSQTSPFSPLPDTPPITSEPTPYHSNDTPTTSINPPSSHEVIQNSLSIPPLIAKIAKKAHVLLNQPVFTFQPSRKHLPYTTAVIAPFIHKLRNNPLYVASFNDLLDSPNYNSPDHRAWQAEAISFFSLVLGLGGRIPNLELLPQDHTSNAYYNDSTVSIHLKQYYPNFCQAEQLNTIAHETFHAYQHYQMNYHRNSLDGFCYNKYFANYQQSKHNLPFFKNSPY